ncbi:MAG: ornithine cyclodeaminase family protein [Calditrichia bacterium]
MDKNTIRFLSQDDVKKCLTMEQAIALMKYSFLQLYHKKAIVPQRFHLNFVENNGVQLIKPVYLSEKEQVGIKIISLFKNNPSMGLPLSYAVMLVFDARTGRPLAIMDGSLLTAIRTGAASGLATGLLAGKDAEVAAVFGAGVQSWYQLLAINVVRPIKKVYIFDPSWQKAGAFAAQVERELSLKAQVPGSEQQLKEADIICTATTSVVPVFNHGNLKRGVHINAIGAFKPGTREIPSETVCAAKVVVDDKKACLKVLAT